ncbi:MAG: 2TM domain-containing protein [Bacteroidota bacterium]|nr:2TM domain-containing protein [Bacteroidota bacterium]
MEETKDEHLWKLALKRANFKKHLFTYIIVNGFLWALWFMIGKSEPTVEGGGLHFPWPIWTTLGWGIGVFFNYRDAYSDTTNAAEKEYQKLLNDKKHKK